MSSGTGVDSPAGGRIADPGHRGRSTYSGLPRPRAGGRGVYGRRRRRRPRRAGPGDGGALGPGRARPAPARAQRVAGAARAPPHEAGPTGGDPLRPRRRADEAPRLRAGRDRLRREAVLARRAARADPRPAPRRGGPSATSTFCGAATSSSTSRGARQASETGPPISRIASSGSSTTCSCTPARS